MDRNEVAEGFTIGVGNGRFPRGQERALSCRSGLILADLGGGEARLLFVEVVATDGAMTERRRAALLELTRAEGFADDQVAFLTAYKDRESPGFKKTVAQLAWGSCAWFMSEPDQLVAMIDERGDSARAMAARGYSARIDPLARRNYRWFRLQRNAGQTRNHTQV